MALVEPGPALALGPDDLARLSTMALRARVIVEGAFTGQHHNLHAGSSIEFAEHKEYAPGDDIRRLDWKAVGRQDRYYIKRFEDETEMRTFLLVDASASMGYGRTGVSKLTFAGYLAAALAYLLGQQGDPAGLVLFDERTRHYLPPSMRPGHVRELMELLDDVGPGARTDLARALGHLADLAERRSLVVLFSDFLDAEGPEMDALTTRRRRGPDVAAERARGPVAERLAQLRSRGHDVVVFHVLHPDEVALPFDDLTLFEGIEPEDARTLMAEPRDLREAFARESQELRDRWRRACLESRIEYHFVTTTERPAEILRSFLTGRRHARRRA